MEENRGGWEYWGGSCLGEYTWEDTKIRFIIIINSKFDKWIHLIVVSCYLMTYSRYKDMCSGLTVCVGLLRRVCIGKRCETGAVWKLHGLQRRQSRHAVNDGNVLRRRSAQAWVKNVVLLQDTLHNTANMCIIYKLFFFLWDRANMRISTHIFIHPENFH